MAKTIKEFSRGELNPAVEGHYSYEDINAGCMQRIADSLEKIEQPYLKLIEDVDYLRKRNKELNNENQRMSRRISALKGVITKLKNNNEKH